MNLQNRRFRCIRCGSIADAPKKKSRRTSLGHIKSMYCYICKMVTNHIQISNANGWEEMSIVNELTVINKNGVLVIDSREVAEIVEKRHADLLESIGGYIKHLLNGKFRSVDFFIPSTYKDSTGRELPHYLLTHKGCDMVANKMTGEKGVQFTAAYVNRFYDMELKLSMPQVPQTLPEALRLAADLAEKNERLEQVVQEQQPKVLFANAVEAAKTSILVGEMAKILKQNGVDTGQNRFFEWLRENGYLIKRKGTDYNMPTQYSMERELFEIKETARVHSDGHTSVDKTTKVTGKGQAYFVNQFLGNRAS